MYDIDINFISCLMRFQILGQAGTGGILKDYMLLMKKHLEMGPVIDTIAFQTAAMKGKVSKMYKHLKETRKSIDDKLKASFEKFDAAAGKQMATLRYLLFSSGTVRGQ